MFVWIYNAIKTVVKFIEMSVYYILGNYYKKKKYVLLFYMRYEKVYMGIFNRRGGFDMFLLIIGLIG